MHSLTKHLDAAYHILRYLKGTPSKGILFRKIKDRGIQGFVDADWASSLEDNKSTSGYCTKLWGNLVTWRRKKQSVIARSSAEVEYRAIAQGICEVIWLGKFMNDLKMPNTNLTRLYRDSKSAISIVNNPVQHDRMKHVRIDRHFIRQEIEEGGINLVYILTSLLEADILTKTMNKQGFEVIRGKLGMKDIYSLA